MTRTVYPDEMLMRFADGELDADALAEIERAMETDDELVSRVALFIETRRAAQAALKPLLDEPVSAELTAAVEKMIAEKTSAQGAAGAVVLPLPHRSANDRQPNRWLTPIAASLAAVIAAFGGYWLRGAGEPAQQSSFSVAGITGRSLDEALVTVASGEERRLPGSNERFRAIATFRDSAQALCREFELDRPDRSTVVSVACRAGENWRVTFAVVAPGNGGGYAPAASTEALDAYLAAIDAGSQMDAAEEARALGDIRADAER